MSWCPWYSPTGRFVRHKQSGVVAEVVWECANKRGDVEVRLPSGGIVCWFGENIESAIEQVAKKTGSRAR